MSFAPLCLPPREVTRPKIPPPPWACDAHAHVFGPPDRFAYADDRSYTPPDAPLAKYLDMLDTIGFARGVLVQGSAHGRDNSAMLYAVSHCPDRLRGVAVADADVAPVTLGEWNGLGVRGLLQSFFPRRAVALSRRRAARVGKEARADHGGARLAGFQSLLRAVGEGWCWAKLSGAHRLSQKPPDYPDARPFHEALVAANPERLVFGGDWPHPRVEGEMPDAGHLFELFQQWTPDLAVQQRILVANPAKLYGFPN